MYSVVYEKNFIYDSKRVTLHLNILQLLWELIQSIAFWIPAHEVWSEVLRVN